VEYSDGRRDTWIATLARGDAPVVSEIASSIKVSTARPAPSYAPLRFFADFDAVPLNVADFEELHVATVLDRPSENTR